MNWIVIALKWIWELISGSNAKSQALLATAREESRKDFEAVGGQWQKIVEAVEHRLEKMASVLQVVEQRLEVCENDRAGLRNNLSDVQDRLGSMEKKMSRNSRKAKAKK
ncbi:MAG TPA: hypothetical protein VNU68_01250 [Verrucomicrobiae bacterium]|nr:hypothetical protein [Verrucomicrobiae bacterium]